MSVSIADFEQLNAYWELSIIHGTPFQQEHRQERQIDKLK